MIYLPDVNVWVALAIAEHVHHSVAKQWLDSVRPQRLVFCRVAQMGLLRLLTNQRVMGKDNFGGEMAWEIFDALCRDHDAAFAAEPLGFDEVWRSVTRTHHTGANSWTDSYLAAFASAHDFTLVSFDRGFRRYKDVQYKLLGMS